MKNSTSKPSFWQNLYKAIALLAFSMNCTESFGDSLKFYPQKISADTSTNPSNMQRKKTMYTLNNKEKTEYMKAIEAIIGIIQNQKNGLREHDNSLGNVTYHYPKSPEKPITIAYFQDLPFFKKSSITVHRNENEKLWTMARLNNNGSSPKFLPNFDRETFSKMNISFLKTEAGKDQKNKYFIYQTETSPKVFVKFYVDESHLADAPDYPKNFEFVDIVLHK